ncbi:hypothetical protein BC835DRAFT_1061391 [Cytidiella melzeri]|nr:hypothetical protein BC835DRAFT_1061391 [Cytidiella melzeri]
MPGVMGERSLKRRFRLRHLRSCCGHQPSSFWAPLRRGCQSLDRVSPVLSFLPPNSLTRTTSSLSLPHPQPNIIQYFHDPTPYRWTTTSRPHRRTPLLNDLRRMHSPVATPVHPLQLSKPAAPSQHQYGTRIRSNSVIKPSIRLRQVSDMPRRIKPVPAPKPPPIPDAELPDMPIFPPPQVMLHSEDATSKVFQAIGRSFMSVDNKAMTIKDLADMTMKFGLSCHNASAAGQAITTYIRNHIQRCEDQQDQPLLLRHVLSGTLSDDDLVPALHSRTGGAHCMLNPTGDRVTNFRRGTMVWYLSKAAGAPCPFARAGIRLCNYGENGRRGTSVNPGKERKRIRDRLRRPEQCGQKRKRPMRSCAAKVTDSESSSEEERPAPKVKLTLRLNPSLVSKLSASPPPSSQAPEVIDLSSHPSESDESDSDSMSVASDSSDASDSEEQSEETPWCLPAYPRQVGQTQPASYATLPSTGPHDRYWRSPSVPTSAVSASPPPDSPDEDDEMDDVRPSLKLRYSSESSWALEDDDDFFADMEDIDTQWGESPGPVSPPAQFDDEGVAVKQEPRDVGGLLDAWDELDGGVAGLKVADSEDAPASIGNNVFQPKFEDMDSWGWNDPLETGVSDPLSSPIEYIKTEDDEPRLVFGGSSASSPAITSAVPSLGMDTPCTSHDSPDEAYLQARRKSYSLWKDVQVLGPNSVKPYDFDNGVWNLDRRRSECQPKILPVDVKNLNQEAHVMAPPPRSTHDADIDAQKHISTQSQLPAASASAGEETPADHTSEGLYFATREVILYQTVQPCVPAICATELEGIPVYQMVLGSSLILRRVDTSYVNISPILQFFGMDQPDSSVLSSSHTVTTGSSLVCGTWTPLPTAQDLFRSHSFLNNFLSVSLHARFPKSFQAIREKAILDQRTQQFDRHFRSTIDAKRDATSPFRLETSSRIAGTAWELGTVPQWDVEDHLLSVHHPWALCSTSMKVASSSLDDDVSPETPLSPTEEAMFRVLCTAADWDSAAPVDGPPDKSTPIQLETQATYTEPPAVEVVSPCAARAKECEKPLRRSKRVATTAAILRPRTRAAANK